MGYYRLRRYRDSYTRRRIMDSAVRHLKYNDGIKDIAGKIKDKINEAISKFKALPRGRKIVAILTALAAAVGAVFTVKETAGLASTLNQLKKINASLKAEKEDFEASGAGAMYQPSADLAKEKAWGDIAAGLQTVKVIIPLVSTIIAMVSAKIAVAKKQVAEGEDEARVVSEVMTR